MTDRLDTIRRQARVHGADAALVTHLPDVRWAVGFTGSNGLLVVADAAAHFVTDGRYTEQARQEVEGAEIHIPGYNLIEHVANAGLLGDGKRVAFQADHLTVEALERWREHLPEIEFVPVSGLLQEAVASKTEAEIAAIRRSQEVTEAVFDQVLGLMAPGVREQDLAAEIVYQALKRGAQRMAFEPIVASGPRGSLPHGRPSSKTIRQGELVVIDLGCVVGGYSSDMTRTVAVGEPGEEARRYYAAVLEAQVRAIEAVEAGASGKAIDGIARAALAEAGLADYFSHGLGHGVGLDVHEWPRLSYQVDHTLPPNAVVTVEPGVYVPDRFGIRIEDLVVAREGGPEILTRTPKDLLVV